MKRHERLTPTHQEQKRFLDSENLKSVLRSRTETYLTIAPVRLQRVLAKKSFRKNPLDGSLSS